MNAIDKVLADPVFEKAPPVLVDVGAAGGSPAAWRRIAARSVGLGFEPDAREAAPLAPERLKFRRWILRRELVVPQPLASGRCTLHLTRSPQCSSTLRPDAARLRDWAFAELFEVVETREFPATTLEAALAAEGLDRIDWLKCDSQGLDLRIFQSLAPERRARMLAADFEPGLTPVYEGEDSAADLLGALQAEPLWLAELEPGRTPRVPPALIKELLGEDAVTSVRRLAPGAPVWMNLHYLRDISRTPESLGRREWLLLWVFSTVSGQHEYALTVADEGGRRFTADAALFAGMIDASVHRLRRAMALGVPTTILRRLRRWG